MIHFIKAGDGDFSAKMKPTRVLPSGKHTKNDGKIDIFLWENQGKTMGKPWENGDLYGKIHHFYGLFNDFD